MENIVTEKHDVNLKDRTHLNMTGVKKIISFDPEEFVLDSSLGNIIIKGSKLEVVKLNITEGDLIIKGRVDSINYFDKNQKKDHESFLTKLFK